MTVAASARPLEREQPDPSIRERLATARTALAALCASSAREAQAASLHRDLITLAADWAGAQSRAPRAAEQAMHSGVQ